MQKAEWQKVGKQGRDDSIKRVSIQPPYIDPIIDVWKKMYMWYFISKYQLDLQTLPRILLAATLSSQVLTNQRH